MPLSDTTPTTDDVIWGVASPGGDYHVLEDEGAGPDYHVLEDEGAGPDYHVLEDEGAGPDYHVLEDEGAGPDYDDEETCSINIRGTGAE